MITVLATQQPLLMTLLVPIAPIPGGGGATFRILTEAGVVVDTEAAAPIRTETP